MELRQLCFRGAHIRARRLEGLGDRQGGHCRDVRIAERKPASGIHPAFREAFRRRRGRGERGHAPEGDGRRRRARRQAVPLRGGVAGRSAEGAVRLVHHRRGQLERPGGRVIGLRRGSRCNDAYRGGHARGRSGEGVARQVRLGGCCRGWGDARHHRHGDCPRGCQGFVPVAAQRRGDFRRHRRNVYAFGGRSCVGRFRVQRGGAGRHGRGCRRECVERRSHRAHGRRCVQRGHVGAEARRRRCRDAESRRLHGRIVAGVPEGARHSPRAAGESAERTSRCGRPGRTDAGAKRAG